VDSSAGGVPLHIAGMPAIYFDTSAVSEPFALRINEASPGANERGRLHELVSLSRFLTGPCAQVHTRT
jgi:hypothetical protein